LIATLSRIDGVEVFPYKDTIADGKLSIYFTYKKGQSSIEEKAKFIDWLAKILGKSNKGAGYDTHIAMWWMGSKGIDGENEPFFTIDVLLPHVEELLNILSANITHDMGEALPFTFTANHHDRTTNIVKIASIPLNCIRAMKPVFSMSWIATLAQVARIFKSHISSFFVRDFLSWHMKIIKGDNQECQSHLIERR
jgi:hypothetical protein